MARACLEKMCVYPYDINRAYITMQHDVLYE